MTRLFVSIIVAVLGSLFFIGWGLDKFVADQGDIEENPDVVVYKKLVEGFSQQLSHVALEELTSASEEISQHYDVTLTVEDSNNVALPQELSAQLSNNGGLLLASDQQAFLLREIPEHKHQLIRLLLPPTPEENSKLNVMLTAILYLGVCGILLIWLFPLARRLFILTNAAAKIGKGELNVRVPINRFSYINPLEKSFNHMAAQIEKLMADNKLLARSLSHDIRTPMSCLRFGVEAALDCNDLDKKNTYLTRMEGELTRMEEMTTAFLSYAGMERQGINLKLEVVEMNEFIASLCSDFQPLAQQNQVELSHHLLPTPYNYNIDCHWFYRAIQNLISNAVQYAENQVTISLIKTTKTLDILIEDDGKGIEESKLAMVFDPFVKLDVDRSREQGHFGLGLAICQKVIHWHLGNITANKSSELSGASFKISLPL